MPTPAPITSCAEGIPQPDWRGLDEHCYEGMGGYSPWEPVLVELIQKDRQMSRAEYEVRALHQLVQEAQRYGLQLVHHSKQYLVNILLVYDEER